MLRYQILVETQLPFRYPYKTRFICIGCSPVRGGSRSNCDTVAICSFLYIVLIILCYSSKENYLYQHHNYLFLYWVTRTTWFVGVKVTNCPLSVELQEEFGAKQSHQSLLARSTRVNTRLWLLQYLCFLERGREKKRGRMLKYCHGNCYRELGMGLKSVIIADVEVP